MHAQTVCTWHFSIFWLARYKANDSPIAAHAVGRLQGVNRSVSLVRERFLVLVWLV